MVLPRKGPKGKRVMRIHRTAPQKSATAATSATDSDVQPAAESEERKGLNGGFGVGGAPGGGGWRPETGCATQENEGRQVDGAKGGAGGAPAQSSSLGLSQATVPANATNGKATAVGAAATSNGSSSKHSDSHFEYVAHLNAARSDRAEAKRLRFRGDPLMASVFDANANEHEKLAESLATIAGVEEGKVS